MKNIFLNGLLLVTCVNFSSVVGCCDDAYDFEERVRNLTVHFRDIYGDLAEEVARQQLQYSAPAAASATAPTSFDDSVALADLLDEEERRQEEERNLLAAMTFAEAVYAPPAACFSACLTVQTALYHPSAAAQRATIAPIIAHLSTIAQNSSVHGLDGHVPANMAAVHAMGDVLGIDNPNLTVVEMVSYLTPLTVGYAGYDGTAVTPEQLTTDIRTALATASADASTLRMYSRVVSLIQRLGNELGSGNETSQFYLKALFDAVAENRVTRGGCFPGVRNRAYIRYVYMLHEIMGH